MTNRTTDDSQSTVWRQVIAGAVLALLIGGTAPWWWDAIFDRGSTEADGGSSPGTTPEGTSTAPTEGTSTPATATSESTQLLIRFTDIRVQPRNCGDRTGGGDYYYELRLNDQTVAHLSAADQPPDTPVGPVAGTGQIQLRNVQPVAIPQRQDGTYEFAFRGDIWDWDGGQSSDDLVATFEPNFVPFDLGSAELASGLEFEVPGAVVATDTCDAVWVIGTASTG